MGACDRRLGPLASLHEPLHGARRLRAHRSLPWPLRATMELQQSCQQHCGANALSRREGLLRRADCAYEQSIVATSGR